jgi:hypothetical protein
MKLSEAFTSAESRVHGTALFIDMTNSTEMKEKEVEATWLGTYAMIFDCIVQEIEKSTHGKIVKFFGRWNYGVLFG